MNLDLDQNIQHFPSSQIEVCRNNWNHVFIKIDIVT